MLKIHLITLVVLSLLGLISSTFVSKGDSYGCGPMGMNVDPLLKILQRDQIVPCCEGHDLCYRTCNKSRSHCDCIFYDCIVQQCTKRIPLSIDCFIYATQFYTLVRVGGTPSYTSDQRESKCPSTNPFSELKNFLGTRTNSTYIKFCDP